MESISLVEVFIVLASAGLLIMTIIGSFVLFYILTLIRSIQRICDNVENGIALMKHDAASIKSHLASKGGIAAKMLYSFISSHLKDRMTSTKKTTRKRAAKKTSRKKVAKKKVAGK